MSKVFLKAFLKAQSLVIQFVLFFLIGLTIFIGVGQFFRYESDIFQNQASIESMTLINSYFSNLALAAYDSCKQCDSVNITIKTSNTTAGNYYEISLGTFGLNVSIPIANISSITTYHNINDSVTGSGAVVSARTITLMFNRTQNQITIS